MTRSIALFANRDSAQIAEIAQAVSGEGAVPVVLDIQVGGPTNPQVAMTADTARWQGVDFETIDAIHVRCQAPRTLPVLPPILDDLSAAEQWVRHMREQAFQAVTCAFFEHLCGLGKTVVNRLTGAYVDHNSKSQFYEALRTAGVTVPDSLTTNCPQAALDFIDTVGEAVVKPAIGIGSTRLITAADGASLGDLRRCAALFQQRIVGDTLRVHIVGDEVVLVLRVIAEGVDSRTRTSEFLVDRLDDEAASAIVAANRFLGLHYAAWDVIRDRQGRVFHLDCNPGPYVMWLPPAQRAIVFGHLARYLIAAAEQSGSSRPARGLPAMSGAAS